MPRTTRLPAYAVYLIVSLIFALAFELYATVSSVYRVESVGLNAFQLVLVGTALEAGVFLFEVPTGVVADVYSRRLSIIVGMALIGAGLMLESLFALFTTVLLAQVLWGVGFTFTSGATQAWIADEEGEDRAGRAYLRGAQAGHVGALVGIITSVILASYRLNLPMLVGGATFVALAVFLVLFMPERNFTPAPRADRNSWQSMSQTFRDGTAIVRGRPVLITIILISGIYGAASEAYDRLWTLHLLRNFALPAIGDLDPIVWFGIINVVGMLLSLVATEVVRRRIDTNSHQAVARALFLIDGLLIAAVIGFAIAGSFPLALGTWWTVFLLRTMNEPLSAAWVNQSLNPRIRATVFSMHSQSNALGQIAGGPVIGLLGTLTSVRVAIIAAALLLTPSMWLYARTLRGAASQVVLSDE